MTNVIVYSVRAEFPNPEVRQPYLDWLLGGHAAAVVRAGGARSGEVVEVDGGAIEARYVFGSRADFAAYEAGPAVALREDGRARFAFGADVTLSRSVGERALALDGQPEN